MVLLLDVDVLSPTVVNTTVVGDCEGGSWGLCDAKADISPMCMGI